MLSISEIIAKTEKMFDIFNDHFYADELARPAITVLLEMTLENEGKLIGVNCTAAPSD